MPPALPESTLAELTAILDTWTREQIARVGYFYAKDANRHLAQHLGNQGGLLNSRLMARLIERLGDAEPIGGRRGYCRKSVGSRPLTLAALLQLAEQHTVRDGTYRPRPGEKATRDVHQLTPGQLATARAAAELAAEMIVGAGDRLAEVGPEDLVWSPGAGKGGRGDWALVARVAGYSDETAVRAHVRKHGDTIAFDRSSNAARREKHLAGIRCLLDLAATHGALARGDGQVVAMVPDPAWSSTLATWGAALGASSPTMRRAIVRGCRTLALYATRRGWICESDVVWPGVIQALEADYADGRGPLRHAVWTWARRAYNELRDRGLIVGSRWAVHGDDRVSLVPNRLVTRGARDGDFSGWTTPAGDPAVALTTGPLGLADWWRWVTLPTADEVKLAGLPARTYVRATEREKLKVARQGGRAFMLDVATREGRVSDFAWHAGWCARELNIDWSEHGADELCDPAHLEAHKIHRARAAGRPVGSPDSLLGKCALALGTLASPYLEARALQEADGARARGMLDRAEDLEARAAQLKVWSGDLKAAGLALQSRKRSGRSQRDGDEITKREVRDLWLAWSADGTSGWTKLRRLRDLLIADAEREFARCLYVRVPNKKFPAEEPRLVRDPNAPASVPIADQIAWIRRESALPPEQRAFHPSQSWAVLVRDATVVTVQYHVPLRERNLVGMQLHNWCAEVRGTTSAVRKPTTVAAQPWEGELHFAFSADEMKADREFTPLIIAAAARESPAALASVRPDLLELYWMAGGARDEVLRLHVGAKPVTIPVRTVEAGTVKVTPRPFGPGDVLPSEYVFPSCARKGGRGASDEETSTARLAAGSPWDEGSFAARWRGLLEKYADALGLDFERVAALFGGAAPHGARHLFGSHHCDPGQPDALGLTYASRLLSHRDTRVTEARYVGVTERQISVAARAQESVEREGVVSIAGDTGPRPAPQVVDWEAERARIMARYRARKITAEALAALLEDLEERRAEARAA